MKRNVSFSLLSLIILAGVVAAFVAPTRAAHPSSGTDSAASAPAQ